MQYDEQLGAQVMDELRSLPFWGDFADRLAVAIAGSVGAGLSDGHSDLDVEIFVPARDSRPLYERYQKGYADGSLDILSHQAFQYTEFPIVNLSGIDGHHRALVFESIEANVRSYVDVDRWVCLNCLPLHDPQGRLAALRAESAVYPPAILNRKLIRHYWFMRDDFDATKKPLERGQKETVSLLCLQGISHLLKFCTLAEGQPYPYDKWLYRVASETRLGKLLREPLAAIFAEIHREDIPYEAPQVYVRPGHRNQPYENYRLYHHLNALRKVLEANMPELKMDPEALSDRLGAWKPR